MRQVVTRFAIAEHTFVLGFIFVCLPLFDMVNGFLVVRGYLPAGGLASPSQLGRLIATLILIIACYRSKISIVWVAVISGFLLIEILIGIITSNVIGTLFGFLTVYRIIYVYLMFIALRKYLKSDISLLGKYLKLNLNLICLSIIFGFVTGLGNSTYGWGFGTKGFFASGNGVGVYIGVATIFLFGMRRHKIYENTGNLTILIAVGALLLLGTKTALVFCLLILLLMTWASRFRIILTASVVCGILYYQAQILSALSLFFDIIILRYNKSASILQFLGSGRIDYVTDAFETIKSQNVGPLRWLFGGGSFLSFQNASKSKGYDTLETDPFDILFMYGLYGLVVYLSTLLIAVRFDMRHPYILLGLVLLIAHSIIAGHVVFNGMSVTLLAAFLALGHVINSTRSQRTS